MVQINIVMERSDHMCPQICKSIHLWGLLYLSQRLNVDSALPFRLRPPLHTRPAMASSLTGMLNSATSLLASRLGFLEPLKSATEAAWSSLGKAFLGLVVPLEAKIGGMGVHTLTTMAVFWPSVRLPGSGCPFVGSADPSTPVHHPVQLLPRDRQARFPGTPEIQDPPRP